MKKHLLKIVTAAILAGFSFTASARDDSDQAEYPKISAQPTDQSVELGESTTLTVEATGESYQWLFNGKPIEGETNSTLTLKNVSTNDVGFYTCYVVKGAEVVPTRSANVTAFLLSGGSTVLYGFPVGNSGSSGSCPGAYAGYVNYMKTTSEGWGWAPTAGATYHAATDTNRTDTKIVYSGKYFDSGCAQTTVVIPHPTVSPKYRFTVYFPNNVPTNIYAITLCGFDP